MDFFGFLLNLCLTFSYQILLGFIVILYPIVLGSLLSLGLQGWEKEGDVPAACIFQCDGVRGSVIKQLYKQKRDYSVLCPVKKRGAIYYTDEHWPDQGS